jgi:aspartate ammonia-lyase
MEALRRLQQAFFAKATEFDRVLKMGRTHLQDAVPMSLGQEFHGWGTTMGEEVQRIAEVRQFLHEINLGATAIGTMVTAAPGYPELATRYLSEITGTSSSWPATWSRRPPTPAPTCCCRACSSAPHRS